MGQRVGYRGSALSSLLMGAALSACISSVPGGGDGGFLQGDEAPVTLEVDNRAWADMRIYAVRSGGGDRQRLGMVGSMRTVRFQIPSDLYAVQGAIEIISIPVAGSARHRTGTLLVGPGTLIRIMLQNQPAHSQVRVRS